MRIFIILIIFLAFFCGANASAFVGNTGLIDIPAAEVLEPHRFSLSGTIAYFPFIIEEWNSEENKARIDFSIGIFKRVELGLRGFVNARGEAGLTSALKLKLRDEGERLPALAIGIENLGGNKDLFVLSNQDANSFYIVASKHLGWLGIGHIGMGIGRFVGDEIYSKRISGLFFGLQKELQLNQDGQVVILTLEEDGRDINFGIEYKITSTHSFLFTLCELDNWLFPHPYPWDPAGKYETVRAAIGLKYVSPKKAFLSITKPKDKTITRSAQIVVEGSMEGMSLLEIGGKKVDLSLKTFSLPVDLSIGINNILINAKTGGGKEIKQNIRVLRLKTFPDVSANYWAVNPIEYLATLGIIEGFPDGTFKPENSLTRAEFSTLLIRTKGEIGGISESFFPDVLDTHWAASFINTAAKENLVIGYPDFKFRPNNPITRAEGITVINRFDKLEKEKGFLRVFYDIPLTHWAAPPIFAAKKAGILEYLKEESNFLPKRKLNRGEAAEIISKTKYGEEAIGWLLSFGEKGSKPKTVGW